MVNCMPFFMQALKIDAGRLSIMERGASRLRGNERFFNVMLKRASEWVSEPPLPPRVFP